MLLKRIITVKRQGEWNEEEGDYEDDVEELETQYSVACHYTRLGLLEHSYTDGPGESHYFYLIEGGVAANEHDWQEIQGEGDENSTMAAQKSKATLLKGYGSQPDYQDTGRTLIRKKGDVASTYYRLFRWAWRSDYSHAGGWYSLDSATETILQNMGGNKHQQGLHFLKTIQRYNRQGMRMMTCNNLRDYWDCYGIAFLNPNTTSDQQYNKRHNAIIPNYDFFDYVLEMVGAEWESLAASYDERAEQSANVEAMVSFVGSCEAQKNHAHKQIEYILAADKYTPMIKTAVIKTLLTQDCLREAYIEKLCEPDPDRTDNWTSGLGNLGEHKEKKEVSELPRLREIMNMLGSKGKYVPYNYFTDDNDMLSAEDLEKAREYLTTCDDTTLTDLYSYDYTDRDDPKKGRANMLERLPTTESAAEAYHDARVSKSNLNLAIEVATARYKQAVLNIVEGIEKDINASQPFTLEATSRASE